jgi:uncharacterized protein involved in type VI secretion and phage assembly
VGGISVELNGAAPEAALAACLSEIEVRQALNAPTLAVLTFLDPAVAATGAIAIGTTVTLQAPDGAQLFSGEVTGIKRRVNGARARLIEVRAYDRLHRLRKRQTLRAMTNANVNDVASTVTSDLNMTVESVAEAPAAGPVVIQHRQSDFELLCQLAAAAGIYFWLDGDVLRLVTLGGDGADEVRLTVGENILEATSDVNAEAMRKSSQAIAWQLAGNEVATGRVGAASQDALEMRMDAVAAFESLGDRTLVNRMADASDSARRLAQADMDRATARGLNFDILCEGDAAIRPARIVRIEGLGAETDGPIVVARALHRFDGTSGYTTRITTEPPDNGCAMAACASATLGVIVDTDDPDKLARVKARFPVLGDSQSGWMPVLSLGAGGSKGLVVIPEPDDQVLVLFPDGDPAHGIVVGGLYGSKSAPGERPAQGARSFVLRSPSGPQFTLDGCKALVRLESGGGDTIEMGPDASLVSTKRDLTIEAPGRTIKIRAAHVEFERA